ncbi:hypothetical protein H257_08951 [Aphanomyces astaci]|uniref:Uncharacterized protein n=1 Tax=Aphanomyces astaci TaxID=112090 RepID=W4GCM7_APHAT|nr:hypothetical protein H257_08951 [Aphanomyces astaci]ETV77036.1 hypothetical protein H257_08951 [Aphanomyces astaci]|eukprot:XP_009833342.1 hypothetical protein H257_08951 [Aphanomyces astaci]
MDVLLSCLHVPELRALVFGFQQGIPYALTLPIIFGDTCMPVGKAWSYVQSHTSKSFVQNSLASSSNGPRNDDGRHHHHSFPSAKKVACDYTPLPDDIHAVWVRAFLVHLSHHHQHMNDSLAFVDLYARRWPAMFTPGVLDALAASGATSLLAHVHRTCHVICSAKALKRAAHFGHLSVLEYVHFAGVYPEWSVHVLDKAAAGGHLNIVIFLNAHRTDGATTAAMDLAALGGHFEVVKFLHQYRSEGGTTNAMRNAAKEGHLSIVQFLSRHRLEGCTKEALNMAAAAGHLDVVQWMVQHRNEGSVDEAMLYGARNGHVDVVKFLYVNGSCTRTTTHTGSQGLVQVAAANGHLDVVRFIHDVAAHELPPWGWCSAHVKALVTPRRKNGVVTSLF